MFESRLDLSPMFTNDGNLIFSYVFMMVSDVYEYINFMFLLLKMMLLDVHEYNYVIAF